MKPIFYLKPFIAKSNVGNQNKKAAMMFLSKEATSKDAQLKTQMFLSLTNDKSKGSQKIWKEFVFFGKTRNFFRVGFALLFELGLKSMLDSYFCKNVL